MKTISKEEVNNFLVLKLNKWSLEGSAIKRDFKFKNFVEAFSFMTAIALEVEKLNHHPDWSNGYNKVSIVLTSHSANGITQLDLDLADIIDNTYKKFE